MTIPPISGRMAKLKPWHYAVIGGVSVAALLLIPALNNLVTKKKADDTTAATLAANANNTGEPWHPPTWPQELTTVAFRQPPPQSNIPPPAAQEAPTPKTAATPPLVKNSNGLADYRMFGQKSQSPAEPLNGGGTNGQNRPPASQVAAEGSMSAMLKPTETTGYVASRMRNPWATIEQGRIISCNSVTPMTSQLAGFVKAKVTYDVRSADGTTTLIDRNSDIFGEIAKAGLAGGQERLFVLWRSVLTPPPDLVRITLNSPAADEMGEAGMPGDIKTNTWKRIGGALMLSGADILMQGIVSGLTSSLSRGNNSNNSSGANLNFYQLQGQGSSLASSLLQNSVQIPDVLHRDQALPCSIFVSGDLDFSSVYKLRRRQ